MWAGVPGSEEWIGAPAGAWAEGASPQLGAALVAAEVGFTLQR
jgi:hypothetical protein